MGKFKMSELRDRYAGWAAAVLGGGPSLPGDLMRVPGDCLKIAVNDHAFRLCTPDFMVYNDGPETSPGLLEAVEAGRAVRVSADPTSDIDFDVDVWTGFYSSNTAAWFALWLGCDPVYLCGMDCYQGDEKYFYPRGFDCPAFHYPLDQHVRPWIEDGLRLLPHVGRVRAVSGPLVSVFGGLNE